MKDDVVLGQAVLNPSPQYKYVRTVQPNGNHPNSLALISCWDEFEAKGGMRVGRDIPSRALAKLLPHILIAEPVRQWEDARIRLAGTALIERFGRDIAGLLVSQLYADNPEGASLLLDLGRRTVGTHQASILDTRIIVDDSEMMHMEMVLLPIQSRDGSEVWILVGAFKF
jgi:hypothetical protein